MTSSTLSWVAAVLALLATASRVHGFLSSSHSSVSLARDVCAMQSGMDDDVADTTDWKVWYEAEADKVSKLKLEIEKKWKPLQFQLDKMVGKFEIAAEEKKVAETLLKQSQREVGEFESQLKQSRQRHAEELRDFLDDLDRQKIINELDAKTAAEKLNTLKELHAMEIANLKHEFEAASNELKAEWSQKLFQEQTNFRNLQAQHRATVRVAERAKDRVAILEQEKRSLRKLSLNGLRLIRERAGRGFQKLTSVFTSTASNAKPAPSSLPSLQTPWSERSSRVRKLTSAVVRYEEEFEDAFQ